MNRTSRGCRLVSSAARSPARWITGPEVARKPTPISRATICARVVLPRPGGPKNSTWSSASRAALRRLDEDPQIVAQLALADELVERQRAQRGLGRVLLAVLGGEIDAWRRVVHALGLAGRAPAARRVISASSAAPSPSRRAAAATAP